MIPIFLIFPGQGSQYVGMGKELYQKYPPAREVWDTITSRPEFSHLRKIIWEGPEEELTRTDNVQPAITLISLMALATIKNNYPFLWDKSSLIRIIGCAGHSLGEYAAHMAAGNLTEAQTLELVRWRGYFMNIASQPPNPLGGMIAILGLDQSTVEKVLRQWGKDNVAIANLNTPTQIILSGEREALTYCGELMLAAGAKRVVPLKVSGAWHSPLMKPAQEQMQKVIEELIPDDQPFNPDISVIANVTAKQVTDTVDLKKNLIEQIVSPVRWKETIDLFKTLSEGLTKELYLFIEVG
ncbi:MAG: ACP S-malonyltransferase, partial [bacterium]